MQTMYSQHQSRPRSITPVPSLEEVDLQVADAHQAQADYLHQLVHDKLAALGRLFHLPTPATH